MLLDLFLAMSTAVPVCHRWITMVWTIWQSNLAESETNQLVNLGISPCREANKD